MVFDIIKRRWRISAYSRKILICHIGQEWYSEIAGKQIFIFHFYWNKEEYEMKKKTTRVMSVVAACATLVMIFAGFAPAKKVSAASDFSNVRLEAASNTAIYNGYTVMKEGDTLSLYGNVNNVKGSIPVSVEVRTGGGALVRTASGTITANKNNVATLQSSTQIQNNLKTNTFVGNTTYKLNITATYQGYKRSTTLNVLVISKALFNFVNEANFHFGAGFSKTSILTNCANLYFGGSARNCMHRIIDGRINAYGIGDYVRRLYNAVLGRNPDQGGYDFWVHSLQYGSSRMDVLNGFLYSEEFANRCKSLKINL